MIGRYGCAAIREFASVRCIKRASLRVLYLQCDGGNERAFSLRDVFNIVSIEEMTMHVYNITMHETPI